MPNVVQLSWLTHICAPAAIAAQRATDLPAGLTAAQCIFESGWGSRSPGNNCFGIKVDAHGAGVQYVLTREFIDGTWEQKPLAFEKYDTIEDCFVDHSRLITSGEPYQVAWRQFKIDGNVMRLILAIGPIYATAPGYGKMIAEEAGSWYVTQALQAAGAL